MDGRHRVLLRLRTYSVLSTRRFDGNLSGMISILESPGMPDSDHLNPVPRPLAPLEDTVLALLGHSCRNQNSTNQPKSLEQPRLHRPRTTRTTYVFPPISILRLISDRQPSPSIGKIEALTLL